MRGTISTALSRIAFKLSQTAQFKDFHRPQNTVEPLIFRGEAVNPTGLIQKLGDRIHRAITGNKRLPTAVFYRRHRTGDRWIKHHLKQEYRRKAPWILKLINNERKLMRTA